MGYTFGYFLARFEAFDESPFDAHVAYVFAGHSRKDFRFFNRYMRG